MGVVDESDPVLPESESLALVASEASEKERRRQESMQFYGATTLKEFAGRFGLGGIDAVKTLKRYIEKGRGVVPADLPPFQRPHELAAWWRRMQAAGVMGKQPPGWMVLLEQTGTSEASEPSSPVNAQGSVPDESGAQAKLPSTAAVADHMPEFALPELDANASGGEKQLFDFAQGWLTEMDAARRAKNSVRFFKAWNEYKAINRELRAWQKDRQRERVQNGELMEAEKEQEALGVIFASLGKTFLSAIDTVFAKCRPELDPSARRAQVLPYRDKIFAALKSTRFQSAVPTEELERFLAA